MVQTLTHAQSIEHSQTLRLFYELSRPSKPSRNDQQTNATVRTSDERLFESLIDRPIVDVTESKLLEGTVLYLAYGSNLSAETFLGRRGINPLSEINVVVPELEMAFDLPGIPYSEPCFANTRRRRPTIFADGPEKSIPRETDYHKDRWHKGLVGVVYEVTKADYAHIIATEGGGASYQDILVDCYSLSTDRRIPVPEHPDGTSFKAHTLFAPSKESRTSRPDPSWAQPSPRYMKLIVDGSYEHDFPLDYKEFLEGIRTYTITSTKQRLGQYIFFTLWQPLLTFLFVNAAIFADKNGRYPLWLISISAAVFRGVWASYDKFFKDVFGEGERTIGEGEHDMRKACNVLRKRPRWRNYGSIETKLPV